MFLWCLKQYILVILKMAPWHIIQVLDEDYEIAKIMHYLCLTDDYTKTET